MNLLRQTTQRITAAMAILAVLLLFVAPVISKQLALPMKMPDRVVSLADHDRVMSPHDIGDRTEMMDHSSMDDSGIACGYCDLLVHVPLLLFLFIPFIWLSLLQSCTPPAPLMAVPVLPRVHHLWHPRAPPPFHSATCC